MAAVKYLDENGLSTVWSKVKGIVTPKADKVSGATAGHLAGLNSGGNLTDSGLPATNIAQKDGSYSGMTVGAAEDLVSAESVASEFTSRITGGSTAVGKGGTALVDKIKGRTLVMNQQVTNGNFTVAESWTNLSSVSNNIGYFTFSAQSQYGSQNEPIISGHKYYMRVTCLRADVNISLRTGGANFIILNFTAAGTLSAVGMSPSDGLANLRIIELRTQNFEPIGITGIVIIDLTLMFGSGSELTAAEMDALYPDYINTARTGYLINNAATGIETVGWNQFDESTLVLGKYRDGYNVERDYAGRRRSDIYFPAVPNATYYIYGFNNNDYSAVICWYDADKNFLSGGALGSGKTTTSPAAAAYFRVSSAYSDTPITVSLSDPSRNGTYEPYWRSELGLNIPTLTGKLNGTGNSVVIFPDGLRSAGKVYDEIVGNKAIKRIGAVDLGSLTWTRQAYGERYLFYAQRPIPAPSTTTNVVCPKYIQNKYVVDGASNAVDKSISIAYDRIYIIDDSYTDTTTFGASLAGVPLYYEFATPEEYILDESIPTAMRNDPYGTERRLPEDTAAIVTAPFRADITYSTNIKEAVQSLPQNYININSMQDFLAALGTLMGGTWTMRPADGKFDFTFTPNPSND